LGLIKIGRQRSARLSGASLGLIKMGEETIEIPDSDEDEKLEVSSWCATRCIVVEMSQTYVVVPT